MEDPDASPQLLPGDQRPGTHLFHVSGPGNVPVRRIRHPGLRADRQGLDSGKRVRRGRGLRPHLLQGEQPAGPLGPGRGLRRAVQAPRGPGREKDRHRARPLHEEVFRVRRRARGSGILLGRHRSQGRGRPGRRHRGSDRDRHHDQGPRAAHHLRAAVDQYPAHRQQDGLGRSVQAPQDPGARHAASGSVAGRKPRRAQDERARGKDAGDHGPAAESHLPHHRGALQQGLAVRGNRGGGRHRARSHSQAPRPRGRGHHRICTE